MVTWGWGVWAHRLLTARGFLNWMREEAYTHYSQDFWLSDQRERHATDVESGSCASFSRKWVILHYIGLRLLWCLCPMRNYDHWVTPLWCLCPMRNYDHWITPLWCFGPMRNYDHWITPLWCLCPMRNYDHWVTPLWCLCPMRNYDHWITPLWCLCPMRNYDHWITPLWCLCPMRIPLWVTPLWCLCPMRNYDHWVTPQYNTIQRPAWFSISTPAGADIVAFLDLDASPITPAWLDAHLAAQARSPGISFGRTVASPFTYSRDTLARPWHTSVSLYHDVFGTLNPRYGENPCIAIVRLLWCIGHTSASLYHDILAPQVWTKSFDLVLLERHMASYPG